MVVEIALGLVRFAPDAVPAPFSAGTVPLPSYRLGLLPCARHARQIDLEAVIGQPGSLGQRLADALWLGQRCNQRDGAPWLRQDQHAPEVVRSSLPPRHAPGRFQR